MKKYELALVIAPTLDEEALAAEKASVNALIERFGGTVDKVDDWGKQDVTLGGWYYWKIP